ncbi:hypothetical protein [Reinekea marinisedimentorum]|uniref:Uncharacterized protein n=1 Tax=Reinekea marinisedimentorum TaxID=230495 RepID=A0A4R3HR03_9GAMM|nr:hypothetical protein [Reinekea marinisedimentorum]TCS35204.1 hypothetical protein BCF53_1369 [Reinekea marinisedimentorum]
MTEAYPANLLIKFFSEEQHYISFKSGSSFFRTPHFYRNCEDRGRGDRTESCVGYWNKELGDEIPHVASEDESIDLSQVASLLIYPLQEQKDCWLQSWSIMGPSNGFELSLQAMLDEFGPYFVVMPASNITRYVYLLEKATGETVNYGAIQYSDDPLKRSLTVKNSGLGYQKELRLFLGSCEKDEMTDRTLQIPNLNSLLADIGSLKISNPNGTTRYCTQGTGKVITSE